VKIPNIGNLFFEYMLHFSINIGAAIEAIGLAVLSIIHAFIPIKFINVLDLDGHYWRRK